MDYSKPFPLFPAKLEINGSIINSLKQLPQLKTKLNELKNDWILETWEYALEFLKIYNGSNQTQNKYRSEVERFILWCLLVKKESPYLLKPMDIAEYINFIASPKPNWISFKIQPHFIDGFINEKWRPFVAKNKKGISAKNKKILLKGYKPSKRSLLLAAASLSSFYTYSIDEKHCYQNPVKRARKLTTHLAKEKTDNHFEGKRFSQQQWEILLHSCKRLAEKKPEHLRTLFLIASIKALNLRISELSTRPDYNPSYADFNYDGEFWWLYVFGKGKKGRIVPIPDAYLPYLKQYRKSRGLTALPQKENKEPIISAIQRGKSKKGEGKKSISRGMSSRQLTRLIQVAFDEATEYCTKNGYKEDKIIFERATTHMLRHTGASMAVEAGVPLKYVSENLGHISFDFADRVYIKSDEKDRAQSNKEQAV